MGCALIDKVTQVPSVTLRVTTPTVPIPLVSQDCAFICQSFLAGLRLIFIQDGY